MLPPEAAPPLYRELVKTAAHAEWGAREKVLALSALFERLYIEATRQEQLIFSTLFARISYAGHKYNLQPETLRLVHAFRRIAARVRTGGEAQDRDVRLAVKAVSESILIFCGAAIPVEVLAYLPEEGEWTFRPPEVWSYKSRARVVALRDHAEHNFFLAEDEENPGHWVRVRYRLPERNDNFDHTIDIVRKVFGFPCTLSLIDIDIDAHGDYRPRAFVVEPDYLVDVSAVADCFRETDAEPYTFLIKKFLPNETTIPKFLGNVANYFLDRLLNEPEVDWKTLYAETFQCYPLTYAPMTDQEVRDISNKAQKHYVNLKAMAAGGFAAQGIETEDCVLEPTFFSEQYGLQGRLDLFYERDGRAAIVELKSGSPYRPNAYGIQRSHFTQTLLYDLLVRSAYGPGMDPTKYILYSGADVQQLRFAPTIAPEQWEALHVRNQLVAIERSLSKVRPGQLNVGAFNRLHAAATAAPKKGDFHQRDCGLFQVAYAALSETEKLFFNAFCGFIAREQWLAKVGDDQSETVNGHAALWRSSFADKQMAFALLSHLEIVENHASEPDPTITFRRTDKTNPLANFRTGDIAVLYPVGDDDDTVLNHQVIKCTIIELTKTQVTVQLRSRQFNLKPFANQTAWNLEPDLMDKSFTTMYRNLFDWASAKPEKRALLLTERAPAALAVPIPALAGVEAKDLTPEQAEVFQKIIASKEYFLLWGPPGTGKTSVMLRALAGWVLTNTEDNLLLLAYTNRAVDEICEALDSLGGAIRGQYVRIGSRFSTNERYREQLLNTRIAGVRSRAELRAVLDERRIFVSTVASFASNDSLLKLKKFQRLVVDEASQLLEPQLIGLLPQFEHFVLIGDHRQLPAVTAQRPETTRVDAESLRAIGLHDLRDSYFERLYRRCEEQNWHWAFGRLSHQGRMHADIMAFPNRHFYSGFLQTLPAVDGQPLDGAVQSRPLMYNPAGLDPELGAIVAQRRVVFWSTPAEPGAGAWQKTSSTEADMAVRLVQFFKELFAANGQPWRPHTTLGIITPWRAQIAQIRASLAAAGHDPDEFTIDTVERYQGGARDVIIVSCCVHSESQLASLVSVSTEGVDRKLNVALTRARQHVVVLGNADVLRFDERYRAFIEAYGGLNAAVEEEAS
jgi:DNA replication ATP-dependent helicase Dna2